MSDVKWTKEQQDAIYKKGNNILVAAAAGSGKTAVLVERIINKIVNENIDIDRLLVVTFTNAAASEMRQRILEAIYKKIEEDPTNVRLQRQINLLNKANICTIHSFCLETIRNHFYELDISANFRIGDSTEIELLKQDVIEDLFEEKYFNNDKEFLNLINTYTTYRGDEPLKELILKIHNYIQSAPFPKKWLEEKTELFNLEDDLNKDFSKTLWGKILLDEYKNKIEESIIKLKSIRDKLALFSELEKYTLTITKDIDNLNEIISTIEDNSNNTWDKLYDLTNIFKFDKWPVDRKVTLNLKDDAKNIRDSVKKDIETLNKKIFIYNSLEANEDIYSMYDTFTYLKNIINEFEDKFQEKKREKNIIDFHDIEHFALNILLKENESHEFELTDVAKKLKEQFVEIAIDEYQDSNLVQEYILNSISNGKNIFMVGDVKQSIYKFRQARPELFLEKYNRYDLDENKAKEGIKIQLFKNFRSRKSVLDITNTVFEQIMSKELGDIDYTLEEYLNLGANYDEMPKTSKFVKEAQLDIIDITDLDQNEELKQIQEEIEKENEKVNDNDIDNNSEEIEEPVENTLIEAKYVAKKIEEIVNGNYMVFDKNKGYRKAEYKDIVILLRTTANIAPIYEKELYELNIPVFSDSSAEYLDSMEIQIIMSLLKIINNPLQDIALITVLRSVIGNFTDNDLVKIRLIDRNDSFYNAMLKARVSADDELKEKINLFLDNLQKWKNMQEIYTLDELIWQIYNDTNFYNYVGLLNNGKLKQANLRQLFEKARQYEQASFKGLYNFINFIDRLKISSKDMGSAKIIGENDNVVRIMSIHKSKGLEFPIVFLSSTGKQFNFRDLNENILLHQDLGFGPKYINYEKQIEYNTLAKEALSIKLKTETISEEMRILYVALTRAKEKIFITGTSKDVKEKLKEKEELLKIYNGDKINRNLLKKYKSYLDWIELVYCNNKDSIKNILKLNTYNYKKIYEKKEIEEEKDLITVLNNNVEDNFKQDEVYAINNKLCWEYKYKLSQNIPTKTSVSEVKKNKAGKVEDIFENELSTPKYLLKEEKITPAQKGTLIHLCLKNLDQNKVCTYDDVKSLVEDLKVKNIITKEEAESINIDLIYKFTKSNIFKDLKTAKKVYKEEPFYISLNAKDVYGIDTEENILIQGIIDLFYIDKNGKIILVDYKTDNITTENELVEKYSEQLKLYKIAIEKSFNIKVYKTYIYSLKLQKEIEIL